jgi:hypothetical protein
VNDDDDDKSDLTTFNIAASTVLTLLGIFSLVYLIPDHVPGPTGLDQGLSARFMPYVAVGALTMLAFILGLNVFIRRVRGLGPIPEDNEDSDQQGFGSKEAVNTVALLVGSAAYVGLLITTGFVVSSAVGLAACLYLGRIRNWWLIGALSIGIPLALTQLLWWGLTIQVPAFPSIFE